MASENLFWNQPIAVSNIIDERNTPYVWINSIISYKFGFTNSSKFVKNINSLYITQLNEKCELGKKELSALRDSALY